MSLEPLISEMSRSLKMNLYLRAFSIVNYQQFDLYYFCLFRLFSGLQIVQFWSVNYAFYFRPSYIYGPCWYWRFLVVGILGRVSFSSELCFNCFFLVCKLCKSGLYIITYFKHGKYFIWRFLVFVFLVFTVFKYLKFSFSSNFSCSGNVKVLVCKLYMPGL